MRLAFSVFLIASVTSSCTQDADCTGPYSTCDVGVTDECICTVSPTVQEVAALDIASLASVECNADGIIVRIDRCAVEAGRFSLSELYLDGVVENEVDPSDPANLDTSSENTCVGTGEDDNAGPFMRFDLFNPISECGTDVSSNGTHHFYKNAVQGWQGTEGTMITRLRKFFLVFECAYPATATVSAPFAINPALTNLRFVMEEETGVYSADFGLYSDSLFTTMLADSDSIFIPDYFYGRITTEVPDPDRYVSKFAQCWATPTTDPSNAIQIPFIVDGCPESSDADEGADDVLIIQSGESNVVEFGLRSFSWTNDAAPETVYVHCIVELCDQTSGTPCTNTCTKRRRKKRQAEKYMDYSMDLGYGNIPLEPISVGGFSMKKVRNCELDGEDACRAHSTCRDIRRFSFQQFLATKNGWVNDYECQCDFNYSQNDKHSCKADYVPESDISAVADMGL